MPTLKGKELRLKPLSDREYEEALRLARRNGVPLYQCPTCGAKDTVIPGSGGVHEFKNGTYRYMGEDHDCECEGQIALRARYLVAGIGDQYMRLDWDEFPACEAKRMVDGYLDQWEAFKAQGWGLEFSGPVGTGKSFCANHIGKELLKLGQRVSVVRFSKVVSSFDSDEGPEIRRKMRDSTYLILDELLPAWTDAQHSLYAFTLEDLIRDRTDNNLPTIITTNLTADELDEAYPRTYSLLAAKQEHVAFTGEDVRKGHVALKNVELIENNERRPIT